MKIARFSTGDEPRYGIVQGLPEHETASGESEGHLLVLKGDPLYSLPEASSSAARRSVMAAWAAPSAAQTSPGSVPGR